MAFVTGLVPGNQSVREHSSQVEMHVQRLLGKDGRPLVHVATMGSQDRQSHPKTSQTMQFDAHSASLLIAEFVAAFGSTVLPFSDASRG